MFRRARHVFGGGTGRLPSRWLAAGLVIVVGCALTVLAWRLARDSEAARFATEFERITANLTAAVRKAKALNLQVLRSIESFFAGSQVVERHEFRAFAANALSRHGAIAALHWAPRVPAAAREEHERAAIAEGLTAYRITELDTGGKVVPAARRAEHFPICFSEPEAKGMWPLGLDLAGDAECAQVMATACQDAVPLAVGRECRLARFEASLAVLLPVYRAGSPAATPAERQDGLMGFIVGVYRIPSLIEEALASLSLGPVRVELLDETAPDSPVPLCSYPPSVRATGDGSGLPVHAARLNAAGRHWVLRCIPMSNSVDSGATWVPGSVLGAGMLVTLVLAAYFGNLAGRAAQVERLVAERTAELARANDDLAEEVTRRKGVETELREIQQALERRVAERTAELGASVNALRAEIAQRIQAEEQVRKARDELEDRVSARTAALARSNELLEEFAYAASHDLQEPLRMVTSFLGLLSEHAGGKLDAEEREYMGFVLDGAERMQRMILGLLDYSRAGRRSKGFAPTDLEAVLKQAVQNLHAAIAESGADITHDPLPTLRGDESLLVQLLQNLVANAVKFRRAEPPRIHVSATRRGQEWLIGVRDNGIGIEPRHTQQIFRIFRRLHDRHSYPGTGIGLAMCRRIVEYHGGRIWVESVPGQGSTFCFTLPLTPGAHANESNHGPSGRDTAR